MHTKNEEVEQMTDEPFKTIEEAEQDQATAVKEECLTNEDLYKGGLRPVEAFVRTNASKNALRIKKHNEKLEEQGIKQINVKAPIAQHEALKAITAALVEGKSIDQAVAEIVPAVAAKAQELEEARAEKESLSSMLEKIKDERDQFSSRIEALKADLIRESARVESPEILEAIKISAAVKKELGKGGWKAKALKWLAGL